jgi:DNA-binding beta-propeller fold protein YncE
MKRKPYLYAAVAAGMLGIGAGMSSSPTEADQPSKGQRTPVFQVDASWPKPLPFNWVTADIGGTCVDSQDHVFVVTRGFQNGGLTSPEGVGGANNKTGALGGAYTSKASPPVIEFDQEGNVANSWGNPSLVPAGTIGPAGNIIGLQNAVLPNSIHGCFVDYQDNVWIAGNGDGVVQKYSHDGSTLLLQIGTKFLCDNGTATGGLCGNTNLEGFSKTLLNDPADIAVDPKNGEVYIADGYGNHRVVVFDKNGKYMRQMGGVGSGPGQFTAGDGGHPHCVGLGKDGYVYACDRGQDRINVYTKGAATTPGTLVKTMPVIPGTAALGTAGSAWDIDFSPDATQTFAYISDGGNEVMWIFNHADILNGSSYVPPLSGFGQPGHQAGQFTFLHMMAIDSKGNLYAGETIGGRRIQKFTLVTCPGNSQGQGNGAPNGCPGNSGD